MEKKTRKKSELLTVIVVLVVTISVVTVGYAIYTRIVNEVQYNQSKLEAEQENKEQIIIAKYYSSYQITNI